MMAKVRFAEKARAGLRGKTTSKVKPKGKNGHSVVPAATEVRLHAPTLHASAVHALPLGRTGTQLPATH